ncbi:hypothetical protein RB195_018236 [Necator americanus]|uniref:RBR-type E3 ubiquitin transferase n=1 Tax=Necator americanus TaxID=51031 RepID=A0ABR1C8U3_NECAM
MYLPQTPPMRDEASPSLEGSIQIGQLGVQGRLCVCPDSSTDLGFGLNVSAAKLIDTLLNEGWIDGNSKPCPRCRVSIEKNEGCNKMQCSKCDAVFCWLCNKILDRNNPYGHFNEDGGTCVNRLFEGITTSDGEDEDGDINWVQFIHNSDDETDSELEFFVEEEDA